ncbi:MAG: hypothetical protein JSR46_10600, partial [Verrucomicrobia bacterium]|nr:hypothetical protein [Verrucomicrobiota bacterium]
LIHGIPNARTHAQGMKETYNSLGYNACTILTPQEVVAIDPFLLDFCASHSQINDTGEHQWNDDSVALWRPGGCIDTSVFLPKFYEYLKKHAGTYVNRNGELKDCFRMKFDKEVTSVTYDDKSNKLNIKGLGFKDGQKKRECFDYTSSQYLFCPGEAIGTLRSLGFSEPEYAGFAGPVLKLNIPALPDELAKYQDFKHCMEVHKEGIVLAWQARVKEDSIFIGVAGTKAFYGDRVPQIGEDFARNRHLTQLNMINEVLPEFVSLALRRDTKGRELTWTDLLVLEKKGVLSRWVGRRAVTYDGFPTLGNLYHQGQKVANARCTTHLGSGGVSFAPGVVHASRLCERENTDPLIANVLRYADSRRAPSVESSN